MSSRLRDLVIVRLITFILLLLAATILATIVTRSLVPPTPSPGHGWIVLKNLLLPILLVWLLPDSGQADPVQLMHTTVSGPGFLTGGAFGPEGSLLLCALALAGTAALARLTLRRNYWQSLRLSMRGLLEA